MECQAPSLEGSLTAWSTTISPTAKDTTRSFFGTQPLKTRSGELRLRRHVENGYWSGSWTVQASTASGQAGQWVVENGVTNELSQSGIAILGGPPKFNAASYPRTIVGEQVAGVGSVVLKLVFPLYGNLNCTTKFNSSISGPTAQLAVEPQYSGCTLAAGLNTKAIEIVAVPTGKVRCTITIGAQATNTGGLAFTNEPSSSSVKLDFGGQWDQIPPTGRRRCWALCRQRRFRHRYLQRVEPPGGG